MTIIACTKCGLNLTEDRIGVCSICLKERSTRRFVFAFLIIPIFAAFAVIAMNVPL